MRKEADPSPIWAAVPAQPLVAGTEGLEELILAGSAWKELLLSEEGDLLLSTG